MPSAGGPHLGPALTLLLQDPSVFKLQGKGLFNAPHDPQAGAMAGAQVAPVIDHTQIASNAVSVVHPGVTLCRCIATEHPGL